MTAPSRKRPRPTWNAAAAADPAGLLQLQSIAKRERSATLIGVSTFAAFHSGGSLEGALAIFLLSALGSTLFIGLILCSRRFDVDRGADGDEGDGGGGNHGPRPSDQPGPLSALEPPLGEIRASRARPRRPIALERSGGGASAEPAQADD